MVARASNTVFTALMRPGNGAISRHEISPGNLKWPGFLSSNLNLKPRPKSVARDVSWYPQNMKASQNYWSMNWDDHLISKDGKPTKETTNHPQIWYINPAIREPWNSASCSLVILVLPSYHILPPKVMAKSRSNRSNRSRAGSPGCSIFAHSALPGRSGASNAPKNDGKIHHFEWGNPLFLWPCSIAMLVYQRVNLEIYNCNYFLVGGIPTPLKNDGVRQLGWWHSQLKGKIIQMFQTTNQILICLECFLTWQILFRYPWRMEWIINMCRFASPAVEHWNIAGCPDRPFL